MNMNKELVDQCLNYIKVMRQKPILNGVVLDAETLTEIASKLPENRDIRELFGTNDGLPCVFSIELGCERCNSKKMCLLNKTQVVAYMENLRRISLGFPSKDYIKVSTCEPCKEKAKQEKKAKMRIAYSQSEKTYAEHSEKVKKENTATLINNFINPNATVKDGFTMKDVAEELDRRLKHCEENELRLAIKAMNYRDFLKTLYWRVCSYRAKKKSGFRCATCGNTNELRVHHSSYQCHGLEHTPLGMSFLTCLCEDCHIKHHGII
jgi:hypothetical protein